jgi:hypothetical protein
MNSQNGFSVSAYLKRLDRLSNEEQSTCYHISLMSACLYLAVLQGNDRIIVSRSKLMKLSRIRSPATYHKCLSELIRLGYINYCPTYDSCRGSQITLL